MGTMEIIGAVLGLLIIATVLWNLRKGVAQASGKSPQFEDTWNAPDSSHA